MLRKKLMTLGALLLISGAVTGCSKGSSGAFWGGFLGAVAAEAID